VNDHGNSRPIHYVTVRQFSAAGRLTTFGISALWFGARNFSHERELLADPLLVSINWNFEEINPLAEWTL